MSQLDQGTLAALHGLEKSGRWQDAGQRYQQLLKQFPDHPALLWGLGRCLMQFKRREEAARVLGRAVQMYQGNQSMLEDVARRLVALGKPEQALKITRIGSRQFPGHAGMLVQAAEALSRLGRHEEALVAARKVLRKEPHRPGMRQFTVREMRLAGETEDALGLAKSSIDPAVNLSELEHAGLQNEIAHLEHRRGNYSAAFAALDDSGRRLLQTPQVQAIDGQQFPRRIAAYRQTLLSGEYHAPPVTRSNPELVFVLGFPRSGTTLLESMLSASRGVVSSDEAPLVDAALSVFLKQGAGAETLLETICGDDGTKIGHAREAYRQKVRAAYGDGFKLFIDKQPMNSVYLPHIRLLFPDAPIVFCIRDPRDVCLSCLFQWFALNNTNKLFLDWQTTVEFYAQLMDYWFVMQPLMGESVYCLRYESLVHDPESALRALSAETGIPWDKAMLSFADINRNRVFTTPSNLEVRKGLSDARGRRWDGYVDVVKSQSALLDPIIERLGYPPTGS